MSPSDEQQLKLFTDEQIAEVQRVADDAAYAAQSRFMHKEQISEQIPEDGQALVWDKDRAKFVPSTPLTISYIPFGSEPITGQSFSPP